ncbi:DUF5131 family protein [Myxococcus sp. CA040A]|uniref:DUF5131 family protein n=1 Tax=Myxococcus sp. CA040A TaxID=2741738 RepID=UPI00157B15C3|nr:DUF5131 family protein [Myxococcus sp. CA040A]
MGDTTAIEWCDATFNIWMGCSKVHVGCASCYAMTQTPVRTSRTTWGEVWQGGTRTMMSADYWKKPVTWARQAAAAGVRRRVFCSSLADVLEVPADVPDSIRDGGAAALRVAEARDAMASARERLWGVIRATHFVCSNERSGRCLQPSPGQDPGTCAGCGAAAGGLDWLLLTKRPENWALVPEDVRPLVWLGTSVSDQATADEMVPRLLQADGFRYRFVSAEPLVGPLDLRKFMWPVRGWWRFPYQSYAEAKAAGAECGLSRQALVSAHSRFLDWVIVGGESGNKARPCHVEWVRDVVRQCRDAAVPSFVKQLGEVPVIREPAPGEDPFTPDREWPSGTRFGNHRHVEGLNGRVVRLNDSKGGDMAEWPEYLRVREFPHD